MNKLKPVRVRNLETEIDDSHKTECTGIKEDEPLVCATFAPVVGHKEEREAVDEHCCKCKEAQPHIELPNVLPKVSISVNRGVFDSCTHADAYQSQQWGKENCIDLAPARRRPDHLERVEEEGHLNEYRYEGMFRLEECAVCCGGLHPCAHDECHAEEC